MFDRRLKIFLLILGAMTLVLVGRAMQLQVFGRAYWRERASEVMKRSQMIETTRGRILDYKGRPIAADKPCVDACVDFRAIPSEPDERWVRDVARRRLLAQRDGEYRRAVGLRKRELLDQEIDLVRMDIRKMWAHLAHVADKAPQEIDEIRQAIIRKVHMRRRYIWYQRYEQARRGQEGREPSPWYRSWLIDDAADSPQLDEFAVEVAEQAQAHVILRAISADVHNELGKNLDRYPGLELRASTHRWYAYPGVASHLLGHLSRVSQRMKAEG